MERKLASIRIIKEIKPIEGADVIELAIVDGWQVVIAKNVGHKVGDYVVYCEIDSFLPVREEFEFLRKSSFKKMGSQEGFRLKTIKLRGQISQGLILPASIFGEFGWTAYEGLDVTERLGIVKYEPPIPANLSGIAKGGFPSFLRKTDEERVQNLSDEFQEWSVSSKHQFYSTEKLDGSSFTCYVRNGEFGVCSRNLELLETEDNTFWTVARKLDLENKLRSLGRNICFQGEMVGESIQGNPYKIKGQTVFFYNIFLIDEMEYFEFPLFRKTLMDLELLSVPVLETPFNFPVDLGAALPTLSALLRSAEGKSVLNDKVEREGLVIRSMDRNISFKAISNRFLLKND